MPYKERWPGIQNNCISFLTLTNNGCVSFHEPLYNKNNHIYLTNARNLLLDISVVMQDCYLPDNCFIIWITLLLWKPTLI